MGDFQYKTEGTGNIATTNKRNDHRSRVGCITCIIFLIQTRSLRKYIKMTAAIITVSMVLYWV